MKRDLELIRKIVLKAETNAEDWNLMVDGYAPEQVAYHAELLFESGWVKGEVFRTWGNPPVTTIRHLTPAGHDVAEACRDESKWSTFVASAKQLCANATLDVLKTALVSGGTAIVHKMLGAPQ